MSRRSAVVALFAAAIVLDSPALLGAGAFFIAGAAILLGGFHA